MRVRGLGAIGLLPWTGLFLSLAIACNTILDNQPAELVADDAGMQAREDAVPPPIDAFVEIDSTPASLAVNATSLAPTLDATTVPPPFDAGTVPVCAFGRKLCDGSCVAVNDPLFGCGETSCIPCSLPNSTATCAGSGCVVASCDPGYADCDQDAADGCETDLSQPAHCGVCNAKCPPTAPDCTPSAGSFACATGCGSGAPTLCGNQCVSLQTALDDCGACNNACRTVANGQATCTGGECGFTCQADFHACGAACASDMSPATCGASCAPCPTGANAIASCNGAACGTECEPGFANCNGATSDGCEVNLDADPANCGACSNSCNGQPCNDGVCAPPPPPPPDAGSPPPADAGSSPPADAGSSAPDAGTPDSAPPPVDAAASD